MATPAIEFGALSKSYGSTQALNGLSFSVMPGEVFGFLGPNGAGKTTAIRILFDLIRPSDGVALVSGLDCQSQGVEARRLMGYLPGDLRLYDGLSGRDCIRLFASIRGHEPEQSFLDELLERMALAPDTTVGSYSKGNKQKLGLILALMHRPRILVLDEPTSGLDPLIQEQVASLLEEMAAAGSTVFFSSHVLSEVERTCHRVAIIRKGRLAAIEDVAAIKGRSLHIIEVTFGVPVPSQALAFDGVREIRRDGTSVHLEVRSNLDAALKAIARYPVVDLRTEQPSLEDVFLAFYQEDSPAQSDGKGAPGAV